MKNLFALLLLILLIGCKKKEQPQPFQYAYDPCTDAVGQKITISVKGNPNVDYIMSYDQGSNYYHYNLPHTFPDYPCSYCADSITFAPCGSLVPSIFALPNGTDTVPFTVYVTFNDDTIIIKSSLEDTIRPHTVIVGIGGCH